MKKIKVTEYDPNSHSAENCLFSHLPITGPDFSKENETKKIEKFPINPKRRIEKIVWLDIFGKTLWMPKIEFDLYGDILNETPYYNRVTEDEGFRIRIEYA